MDETTTDAKEASRREYRSPQAPKVVATVSEANNSYSPYGVDFASYSSAAPD